MKNKAVALLIILFTATFQAQAQGFFNQKGAMVKKCIRQIALLGTYTLQLKKGYDIVENGISLTHDLKNGEFNLHSDYYNSLERVNPAIKKYPYVQQINSLYQKMLTLHDAVWKQAKASGLFTDKELKYIKGVYTDLLKAASEDIDELNKLTTDKYYKLTDDERIGRIDGVYKRMEKKYQVITAFNDRIRVTIKGRKQQQQNAGMLQKLYGY